VKFVAFENLRTTTVSVWASENETNAGTELAIWHGCLLQDIREKIARNAGKMFFKRSIKLLS